MFKIIPGIIRAALGMIAGGVVIDTRCTIAEQSSREVRRASRSIPVVRQTRPMTREIYADRGGSDYARAYQARYVAPGTRRSPRVKRVSGLSARNMTRPAGHVNNAR